MANELDGVTPLPEGESVQDPGNSAPEQVNGEQHSDSIEGNAGEEIEGEAEGGENEGSEADGEGEQQEQPKPKKKLPWELRRIHEETNKRREAERELERAREELERLRKGGTDETATGSEPDPDTLINQRAQQIVEQREFQNRVNQWADKGVKEFGAEDFNASCNLIASLMDDRQQATFMQTITDPDLVEDGHKVVAALAEDPEEAERILGLPPVKQAIALNKLSTKLNKPSTPAPKPISKAPAPVTPIGGKTQTSSRLDDPDIPMDKFADEFLKTLGKRTR